MFSTSNKKQDRKNGKYTKLQEQYPEHYAEATDLINKYKEKYIAEDSGIPLSDLQNEKVDKALLPTCNKLFAIII